MFRLFKVVRMGLPSTDNPTRGLPDAHVICDNEEPHAVRLFRIGSYILFLCKAEVEDIASIIPSVDVLATKS
jgi:hypothetical protein